jgi:AraC family transcriptional regulator
VVKELRLLTRDILIPLAVTSQIQRGRNPAPRNSGQLMANQFSPITLGERLQTIKAGGFVLTETRHQPNHELPRHYHERSNIAFVLDGSFREILKGRSIDCYARSLLVKPAGEAHANRYGSRGMRCLLVEIEPEQLQELGSWSATLDQISHVRGGTLAALGIRIYQEFRLMDEASLLAIEGLMLEIVANLSRRSNLLSERKRPLWLDRARAFLQAHSTGTVRLTDVAKAVEKHPVHLAREFRKAYGCTLGEYLRDLRIEFCCRKLSASDLPLVEIALAAGFSSQSHFSKLFKRQIGVTPSEFRSLYRVAR